MKAKIKISQGTKNTLHIERKIERRIERNKMNSNKHKNRETK